MPGPRAAQNKCPTPGTDKAGKCPAVGRWGGGGGVGGGWAELELTEHYFQTVLYILLTLIMRLFQVRS